MLHPLLTLALLVCTSALAFGQCPSIAAILVDACGQEQDNEFIIINSGTAGFNVSDLELDYDVSNNIVGPENNDVNVGAMACGIQAGNTAMITGCDNVIAAGPGTFIPPNSYVVFQTSAATNASYNFSAVCGSQQCIYVVQSTCFRSAGAFSNTGTGTRTTTFSINGGCISSYTYNRAALNGANGDYFIPPGTYGNNGCVAPPVSFGNPPTAPMISGIPATICQSDPAIALPTTQSGINGNWSGTGVSGNTFNPSGLSGSITLTFTPLPGQCAIPATTSITVNTGAPPVISGIPASICQIDPAIFLNTNQGGISGNWSGTGVNANMFNPTGLSGSITLTFTPDPGQCASAATTSITVNPATMPVIAGVPANMCQNDTPVALPTNQGGINGNWSGTGVSGNTFNPSGLNGSVTLTFTPTAGQCANTVTTSVTVSPPVTPVISGVPNAVCENDQPVALPTNQGGINGNWSGNGVGSNVFNPNGLSGNITLTFTPTAGQCANIATTTVMVNAASTPVISGVPASVCENDPPLALPTNQSGISGSWSGTGVIGNTFNPSGLNGSITLTFTPTAGQCASVATINIQVNTPSSPNIVGVPSTICQSDTPIPLPTNQGGINGNWSGTGVSGNVFNPSGLNGNINLTFTPTVGQCATPATTSIFVSSGTIPVITGVPSTVCQTDPPIVLPTTLSGITGTWSGSGVAGNNFNPAGITGNVTLTFTPNAGQCASPATTEITVTEAAPPALSGIPGSMCESDPPVALPTTQSGITGTWSGPGVSSNNFNPAGQNGNIALTFTPNAGQCALSATANINVIQSATPALESDAVCQNSGLYDLGQLVDPNWPNGSWSGPGVSGNNFNPAGQNGTINLTFTPTASCTNPGSTTISILTEPTFSGLVESCDPGTQTYIVSFNISGGDPASYTVDGVPVGGSTFTSAPLASGTAYSFQLDDANGCGPVTVSGVENCACATNAGTMNLAGSPLMICADGAFTVIYNNNQMLDADDVLIFVLHDNPGAVLGNIISTSMTTTFTSFPGIVLGQTYYVSAVAGNDDGTGNPDLNDGCLSVSQGVPIIFYRPTVQIGNGGAICNDVCFDVPVDFNGIPPFILEFYLYGSGVGEIFTIFDIAGDTTISICPSDYGFLSGMLSLDVMGLADSICIGDLLPNLDIEVAAPSAASLTPDLCPGEQIVVNGTVYDESNPTGVETFVGGNHLGCDSTLNVSLSFFPAAVLNLSQTLCPGSSITVNGTVYDESNPTGTEVLPNASFNGCDSTININLTFNSVVTGDLVQTLCPGGSITINGNTYGETNPSGSETFPGGSYLGCDSTVNISLSFYPAAVFNLNEMLCTGGSLTVNGKVYDESNPSGTEILADASANGCDSIVNVSLTFATQVVNNLSLSLCPGETVTVNGNVYDATNPIGSETFVGGSYLGCDSIVDISLSFYPPAVLNLNQTLCTGGSLTVNGTVYDETNPSGTEILLSGSANGCDSIINVSLTFNSEVVFDLNQILCAGDFITVNGNVYDQATPNGSETFPMGSYLGCDSTVNVNLSFYPPAEFDWAATFCSDTSILVNGTVYDANNPSGSEILANASVNGCDSTVNINFTFNGAAVEDLTATLCEGGFITVNGTTYDASNPTGSETFPGSSYLGCDSIVNINLLFYPPIVVDVSETLCAGGSLTVNGTLYNAANPIGTEVMQASNGCDSTVNVSLSFFAPSIFTIDDQLCTGGSITVNGTVYDESNPSGSEVLLNAASNGCDSTVVVDLSFGDEVVVDYNPILCAGESIVINGTIYFAGNTTGTETFPDASYLGCDSTININLGFYPEAIFTLDTILQPGQSIVVNGTMYNQTNLNGTEVIPGGSANGCDSIIFVSLVFEGLTTADVISQSPTCKGGSDGFISIESLSGGVPPFTIALNGSNSMQIDTNDFPVVYNGLEIGFYTITIVDAANKVTTVEVFLPEPPALTLDLGPDQTVQLGQSTSLNAVAGFPVHQYDWSPPDYLSCLDCPNPRVELPSQDVIYTLTATSEQGCTVSEQVTVLVEKTYTIFAPNAFSPNNDAINDEFTLFSGPQAVRAKTFRIFDRWGNNVFEYFNMPLNDLSIGWNGRFKGKQLDPAVFVWFAEVEFVDGHVELFEGGVTLMR